MLVVVDMGRGWPAKELSALGKPGVLKQQLCPGKLRCSVTQTQEYSDFLMQLKVMLKAASYVVTCVVIISCSYLNFLYRKCLCQELQTFIK